MKRIICHVLFFLSILAVWLLPGCSSMQRSRTDDFYFDRPIPSTLTILDNPEAQREILLAFAKAYPDKISNVEFINNDWTMLVNGTLFYFARGRFLPEELHNQWEDFYPYDFYEYPWSGTAGQRRALYDNPVYSIGSSFLFDILYESSTEDNSWELQEKYSFLGVKMLIHPYIKTSLDRVSECIRNAALTDPSIDEWIAELRTSPPTAGWNWRTIAGTTRRSIHSYGMAIDLLPKDLGGRHTYWQWSQSNVDLDTDTFYMPPEAVIRAFETYGFIWGGYWDLIDTMHFEYRPEILLLNNISIGGLY